MSAARVRAEAKINLFLRILSREPTGYHQLETLFQRISLADVVTVRTNVGARSLDCHGLSPGADIGPVERNLAWRAALAFADVARWPAQFAIEIEKHIPIGGGLGGGSADAAAVLRALNALAPAPIDHEALGRIAFSLGADVPYLTTELALALGTGRGEQLVPFEPLASRAVRLVLPPFGVSSKDAFGWYAADRAGRTPELVPLVPVIGSLDWTMARAMAGNDLESPVFARHRELPVLLAQLTASGASIARMTGSGSTLFAIYDGAAPTELIDAPGVRIVDARTLERVTPIERM